MSAFRPEPTVSYRPKADVAYQVGLRHPRRMTWAERRVLHSLAWMCEQYLRTPEGDLDHLCMSAGEEAIEVLSSYGLIEMTDRGGRWTAQGQALLDSSAPASAFGP